MVMYNVGFHGSFLLFCAPRIPRCSLSVRRACTCAERNRPDVVDTLEDLAAVTVALHVAGCVFILSLPPL